MSDQSLAKLFLLAPLAVAGALVLGAQPGSAAYSCRLDPTAPTTTCFGGPVAGTILANPYRLAVVDLNQGSNWLSATLRVELCNSTGWTTHISDSPTANGFGGDSGSTNHDSEAHALNAVLSVYKSDIGTGPVLSCQYVPPPSTAGCITQAWTIINDQLTFDPNVATNTGTAICANSSLFDFPLYDEADAEDAGLLYEDKLYVGLNRTYGSAARTGTGVTRACFYLDTVTAPSQAAITAACGF